MVKVRRTSSVRLSLLMALVIVGVTPAVISPSFSSRSLSELEEDLEDIMEGNGGDGDDNSNGNNGDSGRAVPSESRSTNGEDGEEDDDEIKVFTDNPPNYPLYITSYQLDEESNSLINIEMLNIDGEIKNDGTDIENFVKLTATFYDADNGTLGSDIAFTDPTTLEPGQSAPFKMIGGALGNLDVDEIRYVKFHISSQ